MGEGIQTDTICLPASGPCGLSGLLSRPDGAFAEGLTPSPEYLATVTMGGGQGPVSLADGLSEQEVLPGPLTGPRSPPVPPGQLCLDLFGGFCHYPPKPLSLLIWDQARVEPRERSRVSPPGPLAPRVPGPACMETFEGRAAWLLPYFFFLSCTLYLELPGCLWEFSSIWQGASCPRASPQGPLGQLPSSELFPGCWSVLQMSATPTRSEQGPVDQTLRNLAFPGPVRLLIQTLASGSHRWAQRWPEGSGS